MAFQSKYLFKRVLRPVILFVIAIALSMATAQPGAAQFALPQGPGTSTAPPPEVTRFGSMEAISVESPLSDRGLFTIASPAVHDRHPAAIGDQLLVEQRAKEIQSKLLLLLQRDIDPESLMFGVSQLNNVTIITVRDDQYPQPLVLASVTANDAEFNGLPPEDLAEQWREIMVAEPEVLGIDSVTHSGMTITVWIRTQPTQQWAVGREFRLRVREDMEANGIEIGMPQQEIEVRNSEPIGERVHA